MEQNIGMPRKKPNPIAKDLRTPKYRMRVVVKDNHHPDAARLKDACEALNEYMDEHDFAGKIADKMGNVIL